MALTVINGIDSRPFAPHAPCNVMGRLAAAATMHNDLPNGQPPSKLPVSSSNLQPLLPSHPSLPLATANVPTQTHMSWSRQPHPLCRPYTGDVTTDRIDRFIHLYLRFYQLLQLLRTAVHAYPPYMHASIARRLASSKLFACNVIQKTSQPYASSGLSPKHLLSICAG